MQDSNSLTWNSFKEIWKNALYRISQAIFISEPISKRGIEYLSKDPKFGEKVVIALDGERRDKTIKISLEGQEKPVELTVN